MKRFAVIISLALSYVPILAQNNHADCSNAIELTSNSITIDKVDGFGNKLEFSRNKLGNHMYFTDEHNSVWLSFKAPHNGELTFEITPNNPVDDWDFMLFEAGLDQCSQIADKSLKPIRGNLARNDAKTGGLTGLNKAVLNEFSAAGVNSNMSKYLEVFENKEYILVIDINENNGNGFDFHMNIEAFQTEEVHIEATHIEDEGFGFVDMTEEASEEKIKIDFKVLMEGTEEEVSCRAEIVGVSWSDTGLVFENSSRFSAEIPKDKWFYVNVKKDGYTFGTEKYKANEELAKTSHNINISKVAQGNHIVLKEIVFRENTTHLLPSSINALEQLINFMEEYPSATIEIQGHVNAPGYDNDGKVKKFSLKRAEQIKGYLVDAGVEGKRIKVAGMGNEFMLYPNPKSYDEEKANRRVEIEILSF